MDHLPKKKGPYLQLAVSGFHDGPCVEFKVLTFSSRVLAKEISNETTQPSHTHFLVLLKHR
jgi:hypothetical protein